MESNSTSRRSLPPSIRMLTKWPRADLQDLAAKSAPSVELPPLYLEQERIKNEARRYNVVCVGRRAGKSYLGIRLIIETAIAGDPAALFAPSYKILLESWDALTRLLRPVAARVNVQERRIEMANGATIEVWTLDNPDAGRSRKYKRVVIDEAAMVPHLKEAWENSIRPTLTDLEGDAWFLSTPRGLNYFHDLYQKGLSAPDWKSWQMTSSVNPFLPSGEIEAARRELPALAFRQEYLAEFIQADGSVFRNVEACLTAPATKPTDHLSHLVVAAVDWGRAHDFTAISILCVHCRAEVLLDRFNRVGWDFQRGRLLQLLELWNVRYARVETNSIGSPNLEALREAAPKSVSLIGFETTTKSKPKLILSLALALEKATVQWLDDPIGKHELLAYEATVTESGYTKYGAPEGGFDDTVIARALALKAAKPYLFLYNEEDDELPEEISTGKMLDNPWAYFPRRRKQKENWTDQFWGDAK